MKELMKIIFFNLEIIVSISFETVPILKIVMGHSCPFQCIKIANRFAYTVHGNLLERHSSEMIAPSENNILQVYQLCMLNSYIRIQPLFLLSLLSLSIQKSIYMVYKSTCISLD